MVVVWGGLLLVVITAAAAASVGIAAIAIGITIAIVLLLLGRLLSPVRINPLLRDGSEMRRVGSRG